MGRASWKEQLCHLCACLAGPTLHLSLPTRGRSIARRGAGRKVILNVPPDARPRESDAARVDLRVDVRVDAAIHPVEHPVAQDEARHILARLALVRVRRRLEVVDAVLGDDDVALGYLL